MDWQRIARHLMMPAWRVRRQFPPAMLQRIEQAIAASERIHDGQIRFAVEGALDLLPLLTGVSARERAIEAFSAMRVWDTANNNGVLIYLLLADHDVEVVADRGIHGHVGADGWERICQEMEAQFRAGRFEQGVILGIEAVGNRLAEHFPASGAGANELPDKPALL